MNHIHWILEFCSSGFIHSIRRVLFIKFYSSSFICQMISANSRNRSRTTRTVTHNLQTKQSGTQSVNWTQSVNRTVSQTVNQTRLIALDHSRQSPNEQAHHFLAYLRSFIVRWEMELRNCICQRKGLQRQVQIRTLGTLEGTTLANPPQLLCAILAKIRCI